MSRDEPATFDREWANAVWEFVTGVDDREKARDQRNQDLIRVHQAGWKLVADAISAGLGGIADALRRR